MYNFIYFRFPISAELSKAIYVRPHRLSDCKGFITKNICSVFTYFPSSHHMIIQPLKNSPLRMKIAMRRMMDLMLVVGLWMKWMTVATSVIHQTVSLEIQSPHLMPLTHTLSYVLCLTSCLTHTLSLVSHPDLHPHCLLSYILTHTHFVSCLTYRLTPTLSLSLVSHPEK